MIQEIWKDIPGFEGLYQASNLGRIKSLEREYYSGMNNLILRKLSEKIKNTRNSGNGYKLVSLGRNGEYKSYFLHRVIASAFIPNPNNLPQVNHKDGNKFNNAVDNLEWVTISENIKHAFRTGLKQVSESFLKKRRIGADNPRARAVIQLSLDGYKIKEWPSMTDAANELGFKRNNINACAGGKQHTAHGFKWKYLNAA